MQGAEVIKLFFLCGGAPTLYAPLRCISGQAAQSSSHDEDRPSMASSSCDEEGGRWTDGLMDEEGGRDEARMRGCPGVRSSVVGRLLILLIRSGPPHPPHSSPRSSSFGSSSFVSSLLILLLILLLLLIRSSPPHLSVICPRGGVRVEDGGRGRMAELSLSSSRCGTMEFQNRVVTIRDHTLGLAPVLLHERTGYFHPLLYLLYLRPPQTAK